MIIYYILFIYDIFYLKGKTLWEQFSCLLSLQYSNWNSLTLISYKSYELDKVLLF